MFYLSPGDDVYAHRVETQKPEQIQPHSKTELSLLCKNGRDTVHIWRLGSNLEMSNAIMLQA